MLELKKICLILYCLFSIQASLAAELPVLGDSTSGIISLEEEYQIGQIWLSNARAHTKLIYDPMLNDYLEHLVYRLAAHSELKTPRLTVLVLDQESINAFAVPGGVIGINVGLLLYAESEAELSAVLSHEIAHLSQRHFARSLAESQNTQRISFAALLASIAIAATQGADPGLAAIASTQAFAVQSSLEFSRQNEQEADRLGMNTLAASGMDPYAMPRLFQKMKDASNIPEFLLTHPVTESRIADANNKAAQFPPAPLSQEDLEYQLIRTRTLIMLSKASHKDDIRRFAAALSDINAPTSNTIYRYGLANAYIKAQSSQEALKILQSLRQQDPTRIDYIITEAEALLISHQYVAASTLLQQALAMNPNNYVLSVYEAKSLLRNHQAAQAVSLLETQLAKQPNNIYLWRLLADASSAAHHNISAYQAQAEILFLLNQHNQAIEQLKYALNLAKNNYQLSAKIALRIEEIKQYKKNLAQF